MTRCSSVARRHPFLHVWGMCLTLLLPAGLLAPMHHPPARNDTREHHEHTAPAKPMTPSRIQQVAANMLHIGKRALSWSIEHKPLVIALGLACCAVSTNASWIPAAGQEDWVWAQAQAYVQGVCGSDWPSRAAASKILQFLNSSSTWTWLYWWFGGSWPALQEQCRSIYLAHPCA